MNIRITASEQNTLELMLFEPPFTNISSNGLIDVFNLEQSAEIESLVERINQNAVVR